MFITTLIVVIFIIEALVELVEMHVKMVQEGGYQYKPTMAFLLGLGSIFVFSGLDIFEYLDVEVMLSGIWYQLAAGLLLGIILARYSGQLNSVLEILTGLKDRMQTGE